jgi:hypothetical protein
VNVTGVPDPTTVLRIFAVTVVCSAFVSVNVTEHFPCPFVVQLAVDDVVLLNFADPVNPKSTCV